MESVFKQNLELLSRKGRPLFDAMREAEPLAGARVVDTPSGLPTLSVPAEDGNDVLIHSRYDPAAEAEKLVASYDFEDANTVIVLGFGLGYHVEAIMNAHPEIDVVVAEPNTALLRLAMAARDLSGIIKGRVAFLLESEPVEVRERLFGSGMLFIHGRTVLFPHNPSLRVTDFSTVRRSISEAHQWMTINAQTGCLRAAVYQDNAIRNIPQIVKSHGVRHLEGALKGVPAICVAAGPSLEKNVDLLREVQGRALIIAVNTAFKILLRHDIKPDIICAMDFNSEVYDHFAGVMDQAEDVVLCYDGELHHSVVRDYPGPKVAYTLHKATWAWLEEYLRKGAMNKGCTVAHTAFHLAEHLGADPIVLIGQDLSYPEGPSHAEGASRRTQCTVITTADGKNRLLRVKPDGTGRIDECIMVEDINGDPVPTTPDMFAYITHFGDIIAHCPSRVIDATEGGAKLDGAEILALREVIDTYCKQGVDVRATLQQRMSLPEETDVVGLREALASTAASLKRVAEWGDQGAELMEKLRNLKDKGLLLNADASFKPRAERLARECEELTHKITAEPPHVHCFIAALADSNLYIMRGHDIAERRMDEREKLVNRLEKIDVFYGAMRGAAPVAAELVENALAGMGADEQPSENPVTDRAEDLVALEAER